MLRLAVPSQARGLSPIIISRDRVARKHCSAAPVNELTIRTQSVYLTDCKATLIVKNLCPWWYASVIRKDEVLMRNANDLLCCRSGISSRKICHIQWQTDQIRHCYSMQCKCDKAHRSHRWMYHTMDTAAAHTKTRAKLLFHPPDSRPQISISVEADLTLED